MAECRNYIYPHLNIKKVRKLWVSQCEKFYQESVDDLVTDPIFGDLIDQVQLAFPKASFDEWLIYAVFTQREYREYCLFDDAKLYFCYIKTHLKEKANISLQSQLMQPTRPNSCPPLSEHQHHILERQENE